MNIDQLTNPTVRQAIEALQNGDKDTWFALFSDTVTMTDDGNPKDFRSFFDHAIGEEKFLSIDQVENDGLDIRGTFQAGKWGTFRVYFTFSVNENGLIDKIDIGQA